jgi:lipopolysaccharide transport system ATP-binding protein
MSDWIIKVEKLGKRYRIRHEQERQRYVALRDVITDRFRRLLRSPGSGPPAREDFWALRGVSFEIKQGEVVGIIGRNGAGKSTALKILSRITQPTEGQVTLRGRLASLLEVGTGFHQELTGRENIFLNGAILGMKRAEIKRKFDEIVAFAEVEKFLDTPVKHYSSGMYVRLAFAVAAFLTTEVLVVDEVLAVGDAEFQRRCLNRMGTEAKQGRTVLLVSHNMQAIEALTSRVLLLEDGRVTFDGETRQAVQRYMDMSASQDKDGLAQWRYHSGNGEAVVTDLTFTTSDGEPRTSFRPNETVEIVFSVNAKTAALFDVAFAIETASGSPVFASHLSDCQVLKGREGRIEAVVTLSPNQLRHGVYCMSFGLYSPDFHTSFDEYLHYPAFAIEGHSSSLPFDRRWGAVFFPFRWRLGAGDSLTSPVAARSEK